jgi:hypothetical protein
MGKSKNNLCLLCEEQAASKKNSHIISKFIGKAILKDGGRNKAYVLDTSKPHSKPKIQQDSPKEDHILCPDCEKYFEILETYVAEHLFKRILKDKYNDKFEYSENEGGVEYATCKELNSRLYRLFILSLFWRCNIATVEPFNSFSINESDQIKNILKYYKTIDIKAILELEENPNLFKIPMVIMKAKEGINASGNFLYANDEHHPIYQLQTNDYILIVSLDITVDLSQFQFLQNIGAQAFRIGILSNGSWLKLRDHLINLAAQQANVDAAKLGVPYKDLKK